MFIISVSRCQFGRGKSTLAQGCQHDHQPAGCQGDCQPHSMAGLQGDYTRKFRTELGLAEQRFMAPKTLGTVQEI